MSCTEVQLTSPVLICQTAYASCTSSPSFATRLPLFAMAWSTHLLTGNSKFSLRRSIVNLLREKSGIHDAYRVRIRKSVLQRSCWGSSLAVPIKAVLASQLIDSRQPRCPLRVMFIKTQHCVHLHAQRFLIQPLSLCKYTTMQPGNQF